MARGTTRAPSHHAYRGSLGKTQTSTVHVAGPRGELVAAQVYTTIDAVSDPELVDRLHTDEPGRGLNVVRFDGGDLVRVAVPIVYHDPAAELLVLVLADAHRHRELEERIKLYERMRDDEASVPAYAKRFDVVYGASGLRAYLEERAQAALDQARVNESSRDAERRRTELAAREGELERARAEHDKRTRELERRAIELDVARAELASKSAEIDRAKVELQRARVEVERLRSEARNRVIAAAQKAPPPAESLSEATTIGPPPSHPTSESQVTMPVPREVVEEVSSDILTSAPTVNGHADEAHSFVGRIDESVPFENVRPDSQSELDTGDHLSLPPPPAARPTRDDAMTASAIIPPGSDPLTTETIELPLDVVTDAWLDRAMAAPASSFTVEQGTVRLALVAGDHIVRGFGGLVDVRVLLHRATSYPVITLVVGPPAALRVPSPTQLVLLTLDIAADRDRQVLAALARKFELVVELIARGKRIRRFKLVAPLHENVGYIVRAAEDHLRGVQAEGEPSLARARELVQGAGFDVLGVEQPDAAELRDDKLAQLQTAQQLRRAIAIARRFARPSREDYLVCTRGFPLPRWRELRRHVLESAVAWGLWMGPELAQVAVSEGLARSRRDLVQKLHHGFEALKRNPAAFDIDDGAAADNEQALAEEARALGVELAAPGPGTNGRAATGGIKTSEEVSVVSGSIGATPPTGMPRVKSTDELLAALGKKDQRLAAALELCERADARAAAPVIHAATQMSRADAVRVLGMSVKFGDAAKIPLLEGLASSKAFLRHGCALALALLRTEDGTQAVIDLLLTEPTEIWREVARAIGQVGPTALLPLASTYGRLGDKATPATTERVAWAMAHVAVRGGKAAVETMAGGASIVAPVAKHALELHASAAKDQVRVRPGAEGSQAGRDVTVNRAFSRRFFEALEQGIPDAGQAELVALEASGPMEVLDEADLIEDDDEELDESDLIQT